jgi:hypothetical protein
MLQKIEIEKVLMGTFVYKIGRIGDIKEFDTDDGKMYALSVVDGDSGKDKYPPLWHKIVVGAKVGAKLVKGRIVEVFGREGLIRKEVEDKNTKEIKKYVERVIYLTSIRMYVDKGESVEFEYIVPADKCGKMDDIVKEVFSLS